MSRGKPSERGTLVIVGTAVGNSHSLFQRDYVLIGCDGGFPAEITGNSIIYPCVQCWGSHMYS